MSTEMFSMKLGQLIHIGDVGRDCMGAVCRRVPGGWVITEMDKGHGISSSVFVPLNDEFNLSDAYKTNQAARRIEE